MNFKFLEVTDWWKNFLDKRTGEDHFEWGLEHLKEQLQQCLSAVWLGVQQTVVNETIDEWRPTSPGLCLCTWAPFWTFVIIFDVTYPPLTFSCWVTEHFMICCNILLQKCRGQFLEAQCKMAAVEKCFKFFQILSTFYKLYSHFGVLFN